MISIIPKILLSSPTGSVYKKTLLATLNTISKQGYVSPVIITISHITFIIHFIEWTCLVWYTWLHKSMLILVVLPAVLSAVHPGGSYGLAPWLPAPKSSSS